MGRRGERATGRRGDEEMRSEKLRRREKVKVRRGEKEKRKMKKIK
ncbi:hypothetical protein ES708_11071 [subsurface metagenome]